MFIKNNLISHTSILWVCKSCVPNANGKLTDNQLSADKHKMINVQKNLYQNLTLNETTFWSVLLEIMWSNCQKQSNYQTKSD